jgi:dTDP-4-dehydrorhamnose 3,5-epimerase
MSERAEVTYKCTDVYVPEEERTLRWDDRDVGIAWPVGQEPPLISAKDAQGLPLREAPTFP